MSQHGKRGSLGDRTGFVDGPIAEFAESVGLAGDLRTNGREEPAIAQARREVSLIGRVKLLVVEDSRHDLLDDAARIDHTGPRVGAAVGLGADSVCPGLAPVGGTEFEIAGHRAPSWLVATFVSARSRTEIVSTWASSRTCKRSRMSRADCGGRRRRSDMSAKAQEATCGLAVTMSCRNDRGS